MKSQRWVFVDLFRFTAVILMLQGHTFDAFLLNSIKQAEWFQRHHVFIHGFTSPIFLFSSGLAFGVATFRNWARFTEWSPFVKKRIRRYLLLLAIGYWLHLAYYSLFKMMTQLTHEQLLFLYQWDALHIIGFTLLASQLLVLVFKKQRHYVWMIVSAILIIALSTPHLWTMDKHRWPLNIVAFIDKSTGSFFPVFPWSIYLLFEMLVSWLIQKWQSEYKEKSYKVVTSRLSALGLVLFVIGKSGIEHWITIFGTMYDEYVFLVLHNTGVILWLISLLYLVDHFTIQPYIAKHHDLPKGLRTLILLGQETLSIYVVHLFIVYGSPLNQSVLAQYRPLLNLWQSILYFAVLFVVMLYFAKFWSWFKKSRPEQFRWFQIIGTSILLFVFLINDWWFHIL